MRKLIGMAKQTGSSAKQESAMMYLTGPDF
jgi:hypothetical protein